MLELSHSVEHGVPTYPSFPTPDMRHHISFDDSRTEVAEGREFAIDLITFVGGTSTYMDAPRHMDHQGADIAELPLHRLVSKRIVRVVAPAGRREYAPADFAGLDLHDAAVLLHTGWDVHWGTDQYATGSPYLGADAAALLRDAGAAVVGIDAILIDDIDDPLDRPRRDAHITLLRAGIPIVENLRGLDQLPAEGARFTAVPAPVRGVGSFPVRAFATVR
jgi:arylformamidase